MSAPYDYSKITPDLYGLRRRIECEIVALLHITFKDRNLELIQTKSRALKKHEIHELMITDEEAGPGETVNRVSAIAFFEVKTGGLVVFDDCVDVKGKNLGVVAGYDLTHMPNHMNVVVKADSLEIPPLGVGDNLIIRARTSTP
jgi:hypothetical protein